MRASTGYFAQDQSQTLDVSRSVLDELHIESVGAMVNTELMVKLGRSGKAIVELGVSHYPRSGGQARGAHPRVIARMLLELVRMYRRLDRVGAGSARTSVSGP